MEWLLILGFTFASSIDNLGIGISYGIRKIGISHFSNLIIAAIAFLFSIVGIYAGQWLSNVLPGILPTVIGALFLFIIGIRIILLTVPAQRDARAKNKKKKGFTARLHTIGKTGEIGLIETLILGVAVSANALTNGLGAGLFGLSPLILSILASIGSYVTIWWGVALGSKVADIRIGSYTLGQFGTVISGVILLLVAIGAITSIPIK